MQKTPTHKNTGVKPLWQRLLALSAKAETASLCLLLLAMICLACIQIALRTLFSGGLLWADPLLRYLVLWSGLLGAVLATSRGSHIALDLAGYLIPDRLQPIVTLAAHLFSAAVAAILTWASVLFLQSEIEFGSAALFNLPSWFWNLIFPLAFGLITCRYLILFITSGLNFLRSPATSTGAGDT